MCTFIVSTWIIGPAGSTYTYFRYSTIGTGNARASRTGPGPNIPALAHCPTFCRNGARSREKGYNKAAQLGAGLICAKDKTSFWLSCNQHTGAWAGIGIGHPSG